MGVTDYYALRAFEDLDSVLKFFDWAGHGPAPPTGEAKHVLSQ